MKKQKKSVKKLLLKKETLSQLQHAVGGVMGRVQQDETVVPSDGPDICWISDCNPCYPSVDYC